MVCSTKVGTGGDSSLCMPERKEYTKKYNKVWLSGINRGAGAMADAVTKTGGGVAHYSALSANVYNNGSIGGS
ncbi:MAG: hypothetical protein ACOCSE_02765 [Chitinivibrionales bacterium]